MIRGARREDVSSIAAVFEKAMPSPWTAPEILEAMESEFVSVTVWEEETQICGVLMVRMLLDEAEIFNIAVLPTRQRQGIAKKLLQAEIEKMPDNTTVFLEVRAQNSGAIAFYKAMEFAPFWQRRGYYQNPPDDAVCMKFIKISK